MKKVIRAYSTIVLLTLILYGCGTRKETVNPEALLGDWYTIKGDVESYSFQQDEKSYLFVGTVGMRPVVYGTWLIDDEKFIITMDNGTITEYSFSLSNDTLLLNDGEEIYTRTVPLKIKYPEVQILDNIIRDFTGLKFSVPQSSDLKWAYVIDSTRSLQEFTLNGYSISTRSILSAMIPKELSEYIKDIGFEPDTLAMTDVCDGYLDENQIITVCINHDFESKNDSIDIIITSGLIIK